MLLLAKLLDFLYPPSCHHCSEPTSDGRYLCATCFDEATRITPPFCQQCGEMFDGRISETISCPNCQSLKCHFDFARAALKNTTPNHEVIIDLKYRKQFHLASELAHFCQETLISDSRFNQLTNPIIVPVPLNWRRRWSRGFNQADEIANSLSKLSGIPTHQALRRNRHTQTQTRLGRKQRLKNLQNAFSFRSLPPHFSSVILVDDVLTTGSTAEACSLTLKKHAPHLENIVVLTALRG